MADLKISTGQDKRMDAIWWAGALIWIGLALGAENMDILPEIGDTGEWWPWIFIGLGPWALALNSYRASSSLSNPTTWDWTWTAIFMLVAIGSVVEIGGDLVGAGILVALGVVLLIRAVSRTD